MVRPAVPDPPEVENVLWRGFAGEKGWDVGANCGQSVSPMRAAFTHVTCFEPCQDSFRYLTTTRPWLDVRPIALSDHDGELELALPPGEQAETGQLVTPGTPGMEWTPEDWSAIPRVTVKCRTADSMAADLGIPDFIKVDTEGHEVKVLQGAKGIIAAAQTDWLIEFHSEANLRWCYGELMDYGYTLEVVRHPHYPENSRLWHGHGWLRARFPGVPILRS